MPDTKIVHAVGDIWKVGSRWMVKFPKGVIHFTTKKAAEECVRVFKLKAQQAASLTVIIEDSN